MAGMGWGCGKMGQLRRCRDGVVRDSLWGVAGVACAERSNTLQQRSPLGGLQICNGRCQLGTKGFVLLTKNVERIGSIAHHGVRHCPCGRDRIAIANSLRLIAFLQIAMEKTE